MQKYGLIGYPLKHSFSIGFFNEKFKSEGIDAEYVNFEIPEINDFMEVIEENPNLCGLNVTIPYKEQVIPFLDELDKDTAKIGAVNVIKIIRTPKRKIKLVGYRRFVKSDLSWPEESGYRQCFRITHQERRYADLRRIDTGSYGRAYGDCKLYPGRYVSESRLLSCHTL